MKNIIKYGLLSLVAAAGVSCESFLNEKVVSGVSYDYPGNKDRYRNCCERRLFDYALVCRWRALLLPDRVWRGLCREGADGGNKDAFNKYSNQLNSSFGMLYEFWENAYKGITRANTALMYLPKVGDMTDAEKTAREGELRFMRAYFYFDPGSAIWTYSFIDGRKRF
ncbi:RagB/SusD family nutrient uptake outer membrane protein [Parabacteroides merdae]|nr:RagB/SusD family nutrient uptake outer membrane protein [Parabacteroides merdae]